MPEYVKVGRFDEFREGRGIAVRVGEKKIAIFKLRGRILAIQDSCPHMGASLADGRVVDDRVVCHWHDWTFDLRTGKSDQRSRQWLCAQVFETKVEGDDVYVLRPDDPPAADDDETEEEWVPWDDKFLKKK